MHQTYISQCNILWQKCAPEHTFLLQNVALWDMPETSASRDSTLRWRHSDHAGVSNHQPHGCLLNRLFGRKSKKTLKLRVTGLCAGNSPGTGEFPAQMASYAENISIWWRHHVWDVFIITYGRCRGCWWLGDWRSRKAIMQGVDLFLL